LGFRKNKSKAGASGPSRTPRGGDNPLARRFGEGDDSPTVKLGERVGAGPEDRTRIISEAQLEERGAPASRMADPPVGFLIIVEGAGKGNVLDFGYGMNSIGRAHSERLVLDFGDERISREGHASVTFDGNAGKYYVQHGGGPNLTYLGEEPVLTPMELSSHDRIRIGDTVLLFLPLCGERFDWLEPTDSGP
jgi:hypothetical protein